MKPTLATLLLLLLTLTILVAGCGQLIVDRPDGSRLKINTLFMSTGLDGLYHDAEFTEMRGWEGKAHDMKFKYNPYTGVEIETESN